MIRLAVALLTFGVGVSATMFWIAYRTPEVKLPRFEHNTGCGMHHIAPLPPLPQIDEPPPPPAPPRPIIPVSGDRLDGKVLSKPMPIYPPIAKAARASGTVRVQVLVDEEGNVTSAKAISGHPLLQQAAVQAAYQARLAPGLLGGEAIRHSGTLSYNFVLQ
jgi:protein TonB